MPVACDAMMCVCFFTILIHVPQACPYMWLEIIPFFIADNPSLFRFIHKFSKLALNHRYIAVKIFGQCFQMLL